MFRLLARAKIQSELIDISRMSHAIKAAAMATAAAMRNVSARRLARVICPFLSGAIHRRLVLSAQIASLVCSSSGVGHLANIYAISLEGFGRLPCVGPGNPLNIDGQVVGRLLDAPQPYRIGQEVGLSTPSRTVLPQSRLRDFAWLACNGEPHGSGPQRKKGE